MELSLRTLVDRSEIQQVIARYAHALDRNDWPAVAACFHADGQVQVQHATPVSATVATAARAPAWINKMHYVTSSVIDLDGDAARAESYCLAFHRAPKRDDELPAPVALATFADAVPHTATRDFVLGFRYVDRFVREGDRWLILHRQLLIDWSRVDVVFGEWSLI